MVGDFSYIGRDATGSHGGASLRKKGPQGHARSGETINEIIAEIYSAAPEEGPCSLFK